MSDYSEYKDAKEALEKSKDYYRKLADWESIPTNFAFRVGLHDDRYFSRECWEVSRLQRFVPLEFIDRDQVYWTSYYNDDIEFYNSGIEDWVNNPFYSTGK